MSHHKCNPKCLNYSSTKLVRNLEYVLKTLSLKDSYAELQLVTTKFPFLATENFIQRIQKKNPDDPLLKQILPSKKELYSTPEFINDPLNEAAYNPVPGLLHKYKDRVLILLTNVCAIHCRYCFRKNFSYRENRITNTNWQQILNYLVKHKGIKEIILSGGDPLTIDNEFLLRYIIDLAEIQHLNTLRIHSRVPIVLPSRIQSKLVKMLTSTRLKPILVTHCNHPKEINASVSKAIKKFADKNITLFNQSVLLKDINDDAHVLAELSRKLFSIGILPYYLHMHDKITGTAHFSVPISKAKRLLKELASMLPGYLVPKLVKEIPGYKSKCPI